MIRRFFFLLSIVAVMLTACSDNDSFSTDKGNVLTFSTDTVKMDTLFSTVPSRTYHFWAFNKSGDGIRIQSVRLERGNQSGFRVNVDGTCLNPVANNLEVCKGDSIRVFVEVTTSENHADTPQLEEDNLLFTLESGVIQRVNLRTYSWDVPMLRNLIVSRDTIIESQKPLVVYDSIVVDSAATLTLRNTALYFHSGAGIVVRGQLEAENCLFRGDRLDRMFDYLPYDRISGQWAGICIYSSSKGCAISDCEIRNAMNAIQCDSTSLTLTRCMVHNSKGHGVTARNSKVVVSYCQLTNTLGDCLTLRGGEAVVDHSTLAQFYPFSANRGAALRFSNTNIGLLLHCSNTLVTGYESDVVMRQQKDTLTDVDYHFADCILRTDSVTDPERFERIIWETPKDSVQGKQHFRTIDEDKLYYDFTIDSISPALPLGIGCLLR